MLTNRGVVVPRCALVVVWFGAADIEEWKNFVVDLARAATIEDST
eukprot:COSAG02_NODE_3473_length_6684_cov_6.930752_1_plen_44_part_10